MARSKIVTCFLLFLLPLTACEPNARPKGGFDGLITGKSVETKLGTESPTFLNWVGYNARFASVMTFQEDTDGNGEVVAKVGDHGELQGDSPSALLLDFDSGKIESIHQQTDASADGRFLAYIDADQRLTLLSVETGKRQVLTEADLTPDANPCLPNRQARFDPSSSVLVYRTKSGAASVDLKTGKIRQVVRNDIWRAEATPTPTWFQLAVTEGPPPKVSGSCPCLWCARFATSLGNYALEGEFKKVLMSASGAEVAADQIPLTEGWLASPKRRVITGPDNASVPKGCTVLSVFPGAESVLKRCGGVVTLWNLRTGSETPVEPPPTVDSWVSNVVRRDGVPLAHVTAMDQGKSKPAALHLTSAVLEIGPESKRVGPTHPGGWRLLEIQDGLVLWDPVSGSKKTGKLAPRELGPLSFSTAKGWNIVAPQRGTYIPVASKPEQVSAQGCAVVASGKAGKFEMGPWRRICAH